MLWLVAIATIFKKTFKIYFLLLANFLAYFEVYTTLRNRKHVPCLYRFRNTSGSLGKGEMLWEHEPQASVSTAFSSSLKLSRVFLLFDRNTENMFSISFRKHREKEKELVNFDYHNVNSLCHACTFWPNPRN